MKTLTQWNNPATGERLEVLDGRHVMSAPSFSVRYSIHGVPISERDYSTERTARQNFERMVEERA